MRIGMRLCVACGDVKQKNSFFLNQRFDSDFSASFCRETNDFWSSVHCNLQVSSHLYM